MNLAPNDRSRYREFRSHLCPRTRAGRGVVLAYVLFLAFAEWPFLPLANRMDPTVLGFPFLFLYLTVIYAVKIGTLIYAARRQL